MAVNSFASIIKKCQKDWECPELMTRATEVTGEKLPFSSPLLNWCTYGGIPRDAYIEFFGVPGGGKSTTSIDICKNSLEVFKQEYEEEVEALRDKVAAGKKELSGPLKDLEERGPKRVLYVDIENSFDISWAKTLGITEEDITPWSDKGMPMFNIMSTPNVFAEDILNQILAIVETDEVGLIVLDSIPSLVPRQEMEKKIGERTVAALAGLLQVFIRKIIPLLKRYHCTLLTINQVRDNMDNPYVPKTPGGNAPKFYASLRMEFRVGNPVDAFGNELPKSCEDPDGYIVNAKLHKQKSAPNDRKKGNYFLMAHDGIRPDFDYAKLAINQYQFIKKAGGWFTMCDPYTGEIVTDESGNIAKVHGLPKVYDYLHDNKGYYELIKKFIMDDLNGKTSIEEEKQNTEDGFYEE